MSLTRRLQLHTPAEDVGARHEGDIVALEGMLQTLRGCCTPQRDAVTHEGMLTKSHSDFSLTGVFWKTRTAACKLMRRPLEMSLHGQTRRAGPELLQSASSRACLRLAASCHGYKVSCFEGEKIKSGLSASPQLPWEPWQCLVRSAQEREKLRPPRKPPPTPGLPAPRCCTRNLE